MRMPLEVPCPPHPWTQLEMPWASPIPRPRDLSTTLLPLHWVHLMPMETVPLPVPLPLPTLLLVRMPLEPPCYPRPWTELELRAVLPMVLWMTNLPLHLVDRRPTEMVPPPLSRQMLLLMARLTLVAPPPPRLWMERVTLVPLPRQPQMMAQLPVPMEIRRPTEMVPLLMDLPLLTLRMRMPLEVPCPPHPWTELEMPTPGPGDMSTALLPLHWVHLMPMETVPLPVPLPLPTLLLVRMPLEPPCYPRPWTELELRAVLPMVLWTTNLPLHLVDRRPT